MRNVLNYIIMEDLIVEKYTRKRNLKNRKENNVKQYLGSGLCWLSTIKENGDMDEIFSNPAFRLSFYVIKGRSLMLKLWRKAFKIQFLKVVDTEKDKPPKNSKNPAQNDLLKKLKQNSKTLIHSAQFTFINSH